MKKLLFILVLLLSTYYSNAQWTLTNGPECGRMYGVKGDGNILYAGAWGAGVFRSFDDGATWSNMSNGLASNLFITSLFVNEGNVYAGLQTGNSPTIVCSSDSGNTWTQKGPNLSYGFVTSVSVDDSIIALGTYDDSLILSVDDGLTWSVINNGLLNFDTKSITVLDTNIFVSVTGSGVYRMGINDSLWLPVNSGLTNLITGPLQVCGNKLFVTTKTGLFCSSNYGNSWVQIGNGISTNPILKLDVNNSMVVALDSTYEVFLSVDSGISWSSFGNNNSSDINYISTTGSGVFIGTSGRGVVRSVNNGVTWAESNSGLVASEIARLFTQGSDLYAFTAHYKLYKSSDDGNTWTKINSGWGNNSISSFASDGVNMYVGVSFVGVFKTSNGGATWITVNSGLPSSIISLAMNGTTIYAGTFQGVFKSINGGSTWTALNNGISNLQVRTFLFSGSNIFIGTDAGVYLSTNNGSSWAFKDSGMNYSTDTRAIIEAGNYIYALNNSSLFYTLNNGVYWNSVNTLYTTCIVAVGNNIYHGNFYNGVTSAPLGINMWSWYTNGLTNLDVMCIAAIGNKLFVGTYGGAVYSAPAITTDLQEIIEGSNSLTLYPNPTNNIVSINSPFEKIEQLEIFNLIGESIYLQKVDEENSMQINLGGYSPGIYFMKITGEKNSITKKVIKN